MKDLEAMVSAQWETVTFHERQLERADEAMATAKQAWNNSNTCVLLSFLPASLPPLPFPSLLPQSLDNRTKLMALILAA
jgi:hypothetical protein